jgi:hypothetical protein
MRSRMAGVGTAAALLFPMVIVATLIVMPFAEELAAPVMARFGESDGGGGRLSALVYLAEALGHWEWWLVPHGDAEFTAVQGGVPHSQITAMFLNGGAVGLATWCAMVVMPLVALWRKWAQRRLDGLATMVLIGGTALFVLQLSLNVPYFKQPWLWAGAVLGSLDRLKIQSRHRGELSRQLSTAECGGARREA